MNRFLVLAMLGSVAIAQSPAVDTKADKNAGTQRPANLESASGNIPDLLQLPRGRSTVIGGAIRDVDPVRDQLTLNVFGGKPMKIFFDERTKIYRDGVKGSLRDLHPREHASVETMLDGTSVFARSIHMLSQSPEGECQGQVLSFDPGNGDLTVNDALSSKPIKLRVSGATTVTRVGQSSSADQPAPSQTVGSSALMQGALVSAKFTSDNDGHGLATAVAILAAPGAAFEFTGNITFLDLHAKTLVVADTQDDRTYKLSFDPARFSSSQELREGSRVKVTASFDGTRYVATAIKVL